MIARIWRGVTEAAKADEYVEYLEITGMKDYRSTPGNLGVYVLRQIEDGKAEFLLLTLWESVQAIKAFAGPDYERAVYYPDDGKFFPEHERDLHVQHFEVLSEPNH